MPAFTQFKTANGHTSADGSQSDLIFTSEPAFSRRIV